MKKPPSPPSVAEHYHQRTNYFPWNIASFLPDPESRPALFRSFVSERALRLPSGADGIDSPETIAEQPLLGRLGRLLHHAGGITLVHERAAGPLYFRAAPSAGGLYPTEIYVATRDLDDVPDGIHAYSPLEHRLVPLWEGDFGMDIEELCFRHAAAVRARAIVLLTGVFQRSAWRYQERAYRRILLDTGHVLGNAIAYAPLEALRAVAITGFHDAAFNDLLFLDPRQEVLLAAVPLLEAGGQRTARINSPFAVPSPRVAYDGDGSVNDGVMRLLHRRSEIVPDESLLAAVPRQPAPAPSADDTAETVLLDPQESFAIDDIGAVIRARRSARRFSRRPMPSETFSRILSYAYDPVARYWRSSSSMALSDCVFADPTLLRTHIVVLRVDGLRPGVYLWDPLERALYLVRRGIQESRLRVACLYQDLGRDCAAAVIHTADLPQSVDRYGDRAYRYLHLDAGHIGERLQLAAAALGIGASGIGGFFDEELAGLLDLDERQITVYITTLGGAG